MNLDISGVHFELDDKLKGYVRRKIGKLDRYIPRKAKAAASAKVVLTEDDGKAKNRFTCEVIINLPHGTIAAKDATLNIYAAVDIVEAKVKAQLVRNASRKRKATSTKPTPTTKPKTLNRLWRPGHSPPYCQAY